MRGVYGIRKQAQRTRVLGCIGGAAMRANAHRDLQGRWWVVYGRGRQRAVRRVTGCNTAAKFEGLRCSQNGSSQKELDKMGQPRGALTSARAIMVTLLFRIQVL